MSCGEDLFSSHPCWFPSFAYCLEAFDGRFAFSEFGLFVGDDASDFLAVAGYDYGFALFDGSHDFGELGFGFCGLDLEHGTEKGF